MDWFEGPIPEAIQESRKRRSLFVVYIKGTDDESSKMDEVWNDSQVVQVLRESRCVAIRLQANSEASAQFCQIYPVVVIPSTYFIGINGAPLEVVASYSPAQQFIEKIKAVTQTHQQQIGEPATPPTPAAPSERSGSEGAGAAAATTAEASSDAPPQGTEPATPSDAQPSPSTANPPQLDDKVQRAKDLLEMKRLQKLEEEKEKEKEKERERRELGRGLQQLNKQKEEFERKEIADKRRKEKEEERLAREKVRAQIAQDRAERAAQFQKEKGDRESAAEGKRQAKLQAERDAAEAESARKSTEARLQFRLPDGTALTNTFAATALLSECNDFLRQNVGNKFGNFVFSTTFPRRRFGAEDMSKTLKDLSLAPSAVIIVLPGQAGEPSGGSSDSGGVVSMLLMPYTLLLGVFRFLYNMVFGAPTQPRGAYNSDADSDTDMTPSPAEQSSIRANRPKTAYKRRTPFSQDGNIRRLKTDDDDDDMTTWNGNSTQQM